jgi:hypothetical protein
MCIRNGRELRARHVNRRFGFPFCLVRLPPRMIYRAHRAMIKSAGLRNAWEDEAPWKFMTQRMETSNGDGSREAEKRDPLGPID